MLLGRGALANYHDVEPGARAEFERWHGTEHLPERVGVPGFLRGRRYRRHRDDDGPEYFILYETVDVSALASAAYLERLNDPTPWTARVSRRMSRTLRTAARVRASSGGGVTGHALTVRLHPRRDAPADLAAVVEQAVQACAAGTAGVHLLEADPEVTGVDTAERAIRSPPDEIVPWTVIVEGLDREALRDAWSALGPALPETIEAHAGVYDLQVVYSLCDL